jgi:4-azaleucine resistance transporter AzlC
MLAMILASVHGKSLTMSHMKRRVPFTWHGLRAGFIAARVLVPGVAMYGVAFGVMAATTGLSALESIFLSGWVYAGSAQMAILQAWGDPIPVVAVCLMTLAMNSRYMLLGAALRPWFSRLPPHQSYPSLVLMGDTNWAMALREYAEGRDDGAFLLGSGIAMWIAWVVFTWGGHLFGQVLGDPRILGIDFLLAAFFATMSLAFFKKLRDMLPFIVGAVVAIIVHQALAGPWYILIGAVAGSLVGALRRVDAA